MPLDQQSYILPKTPEEVETKPTLPDLLSEIIFLAVDDMEKAEASIHHRVNMSLWHDQRAVGTWGDSRCYVCFAGGVMAFTLDAPVGETVCPGHWGDAILQKLYALNSVRTGSVRSALIHMGNDGATWPDELATMPIYRDNPRHFKAYMRDLASRLATAGY